MTILRKLSLTAAASALAFGMTAASAAIVAIDGDGNAIGTVVDGGDGIAPGTTFDAGTLTADGAINILDEDLADMQEIDELIEFTVGDNVVGATSVFDVQFPQGMDLAEAGILNFQAVLSVGDMIVANLDITNAAGRIDLDASAFVFEGLMPGDVVSIALSGTVFENQGATALYSITIRPESVDVVPVPAAGLLFGTAALGGALARRKRKLA